MNSDAHSNSPTVLQHLRDWLIVIVVPILVTALCLMLETHISLMSKSMLYVLAVVIVASWLHWLPSLVCTLSSAAALSYFFVPPLRSFEVQSTRHLVALLVMLVMSLFISWRTNQQRRKT